MDKIDTIERKITVSSPIDRVWEALTVADQLSQWFGDSAELDLRPGGAFKVGWSDYEHVSEAVVEIVDYPTTFSYRWDAGTTDDGIVWTTKVTFTLEEDNGMTTVTVVESGISELPAELYASCMKENSSGWTAEMGDLQRHLEGVAAP
jgi:uncharacterized protein YndB with AHSA1/START domain